MGSNDLLSRLTGKAMPLLAIARYELRTLAGSWLVRLWLGATVLVTLVLMLLNWHHMQTAPLLGVLLFPYLVFPWFLVVMVLGVEPVSGSRIESLIDGILSRPVTRRQYLLASWAARLAVVLGVYAAVAVPATALLCLARRGVPDDSVTLYGAVAALGVVGLVLAFQVSLGLLVGTLVRRPLLAMVILLFVWYPVNLILHTFALEEFSPISLSQALPTLLRQPWRSVDRRAAASDLDLEAMARETSQFLTVFGGEPERPADRKAGFFERTRHDEFSLLRVILGYGVPTLLAVGLATSYFSWKDL
jgi:ABC-type transport system involved in multi-copper enzyme maturation permease subunit